MGKATQRTRNSHRRYARNGSPVIQKDVCILKDLLKELGLFGFTKQFTVVEFLMQWRNPPITIRVAHDSQDNSSAHDIAKQLSHFLTNERWQPPGLQHSYTPSAFLGIIGPTLQVLSECKGFMNNPLIAGFASSATVRVAELDRVKTLDNIDNWIASHIRDILVVFCRLDRNLYHVETIRESTAEGKTRTIWEVRTSKPERVRLGIDHESRWVLRCGQPNDFPGCCDYPGINWVTWDLDLLGLSDSPKQLPVFVQPHVFDRLYGHQGRLRPLANHESILHDLVYLSLREPVLHRCPSKLDTYLVEYGTTDCKLGYLVCQITPEAVVAKTFLFLTMDGTPEGDLLYQRLRVNRYDKAHLGLDRLAVLRASDIQNDPTLRKIFDECNVGHLFHRLIVYGTTTKGYAAECHRYLKLDNATTKQEVQQRW